MPGDRGQLEAMCLLPFAAAVEDRCSPVSGHGRQYSGPRPPHGAYAATIPNGLWSTRVDDLRPPLRHSRRAVQPGPAAAALRRRRRFLPLAQLRVPGQALPGMARQNRRTQNRAAARNAPA